LAAVFVIPLIAAVVGAAFAVVVGRQYLKRRKPYQAIWALALGMFGVAAAFETAGQLAGWSDATYKGYYLFGGLLNVGWLGIGSMVILATPRAGRAAVIVMALISLICVVAVLASHTNSNLLKAQVQANAFIKSNPAQAQADANAELATYTGKPLKADLIAASFKEITFTNDPNAASLKTAADQAVSLGLLKPVNLDGIYALDPLNKVLAAAGESQVSS